MFKQFVLATLAILAVEALTPADFPDLVKQSSEEVVTNAIKSFDEFKAKTGKTYKSEDEEKKRFEAFFESFDAVKKNKASGATRSGGKASEQAINGLSDLTKDEFAKMARGFKPAANAPPAPKYNKPQTRTILPASVDWRTTGHVTPIKNQGACGSCWTFASIAALEAQNKKRLGQLGTFSEQELVDCVTRDKNGCDGGDPQMAFQYIYDNLVNGTRPAAKSQGCDSDSVYPYVDSDYQDGAPAHSCKYNTPRNNNWYRGFKLIQNDENAMKEAVANVGPIAVAINAHFMSFKNFAGTGIWDEPACTNAITHAVTIVGYGTLNGRDYWLLKNSWGDWWGDKGYFKMPRGKNACGIATHVVVPDLPPLASGATMAPTKATTKAVVTTRAPSAPGTFSFSCMGNTGVASTAIVGQSQAATINDCLQLCVNKGCTVASFNSKMTASFGTAANNCVVYGGYTSTVTKADWQSCFLQ